LFDGFYRSTIREGKECEQFTLLSKTNDDCQVQIRIFKNGDLTIESHPSTFTRVDRRRKRITVTCARPDGEQASRYEGLLFKRRVTDMARKSRDAAQAERIFKPDDKAELQGFLELISNAEAPERRDLLERVTPEELEGH